MEKLFISVLNLSISAGIFILAVVVLRLLFRKVPKNIICFLWLIVGIRLLIPFSIESSFGLAPNTNTIKESIIYDESPTIDTGFSLMNQPVNQYMQQHLMPNMVNSINPLQLITMLISRIWLVGMILMLGYFVFSWIQMLRKVKNAKPVMIEQDKIYQSEEIETPFLLGVFRPRIFIPIDTVDTELPYIIAHEKAHIKRRDYLIKPIAYLILMVYWFNPLVWLAYLLLCKDIELACDERVIRILGSDYKKEYSQALLNCSVNRKTIAACPVAFGEVGIKQRVKNILNYKKPSFWIIITTVIICVIICVCFLTNRKESELAEEISIVSEEVIQEQETQETTIFSFTIPQEMKELVTCRIDDYKTIVFTDSTKGNELGTLCAIPFAEAFNILENREYTIVGNYGNNQVLDQKLNSNTITHSYTEDTTTYINEVDGTDSSVPPEIPNAEGTYYAIELEETPDYLPNEEITTVEMPSEYCYVFIHADESKWQAADAANLKQLQEALINMMDEVQVEEIFKVSKPSAEEFVTNWAEAYCSRNGEEIVRLASLETADSMEELVQGENFISFGVSSPWPADDSSYKITSINDNSAQILYYAWTSDPHLSVWRETIEFAMSENIYTITKEDIEYLDAISTEEEFLRAYPNSIIDGTLMDYRTNGLGEALNTNAKQQKDSPWYANLFEPESAARYLLNIVDNDNKISTTVSEHDSSQVHVTILFAEDGNSITIDMIQPYGTDGIWIPTTCEETQTE